MLGRCYDDDVHIYWPEFYLGIVANKNTENTSRDEISEKNVKKKTNSNRSETVIKYSYDYVPHKKKKISKFTLIYLLR